MEKDDPQSWMEKDVPPVLDGEGWTPVLDREGWTLNHGWRRMSPHPRWRRTHPSPGWRRMPPKSWMETNAPQFLDGDKYLWGPQGEEGPLPVFTSVVVLTCYHRTKRFGGINMGLNFTLNPLNQHFLNSRFHFIKISQMYDTNTI